jgi:hypothetical protein
MHSTRPRDGKTSVANKPQSFVTAAFVMAITSQKTIIRVSGWGLYGRRSDGGDSRRVDHEEDISIRQKKD